MTTTKLVSTLRNESKEVKSSVGGTDNFRSVMDFVLSNSYYDDENLESTKRSEKEMAKLLESNFSSEVLDSVKEIYS